MKRASRWITLSGAMLLATACVPPEEAQKARMDAFTRSHYAHAERVGDWMITCSLRQRQTSGEVVGSNSCSLHRSDGDSTAQDTLAVRAQGGRIFVVPSTHWANTTSSDVCGYGPRHHGVDGVSLVGMSHASQIARLRGGRTYAKDYQRPWPHCTVYARETNLAGFGPAYDRLVQVARERGLT